MPEYMTRTAFADILERLAREIRGGDSSQVAEDRDNGLLPALQAPGGEDQPSPTVGQAPTQLPVVTPPPGCRSWVRVADDNVPPGTREVAARSYGHFEMWRTDDDFRPKLELGIGYIPPDPETDYYGRPRGYCVVHDMPNRRLGTDLVVFVEADQPTELVAVIRGNGPNGQSMFDPGDLLPDGYADLTVEVFRDRVTGPYAYGKQAVVAMDGDRQAMLNHAAIQKSRVARFASGRTGA